MDPGTVSIHHPLLTILEEDQSACSDYSVPSDCNCFTEDQKSNEKNLTYYNDITNVIEENNGSPLPGTRKKLSNRKCNNCDEAGDNIFTWRMRTIREKLEHTLSNVYLSISNIPEPDGVQDFIRRRQRAAEFTSRFCRNYLYQFHRQVLALQHRLKGKSCCGLQPVYKTSMCQQLLNAYELAHLALQAVLNHIPTSILMCIPKKLREFLKLIIELTEISSKSGVMSHESEDFGNEIGKYCRDLLTLVTDSSESPNEQNETDNREHDRRIFKNCGKIALVSRFSMYNGKSSMKRKNTVLRSVSSNKKSAASGKESRTSLESSHKNSHISRFYEMSVPRTKLTKNSTRKKIEEHSKLIEKMSKKSHVYAPFNMDNVTTVIETIPSAKNEANSVQDQHIPQNTAVSSEQHTESINNTAVTKFQTNDRNKTKCQTSRNVKLIILPPFEESDRVSETRVEGCASSQATRQSKTEESGKNICTVLSDSGPSKKVQDDTVIYTVEDIHHSAVKDYSQDASLPPQSLFGPLHLEKMLTYETKGSNHTMGTGNTPLNETFTINITEPEQKKSVMLGPSDNSIYFEKMATHKKEDNSYLQGPNTVSLQRTITEPVSSVIEAENLAEQKGNSTELSETTNKTSPEIIQNVILLKIPAAELECLLEHRKTVLQHMNKNPLYMNSVKPWLIVSRLADTVISDILHEIIREIETEVEKIITQMFHLELQ